MNRQELGAIEDELIELAQKIREMEARQRELREAWAKGHAQIHGFSVGSTVRYTDTKKNVKEGVVDSVSANIAMGGTYDVCFVADGEYVWARYPSKGLRSVKAAG